MDIKHRKSVKKSKIRQEKMDIKPRKTVKKSKIIRKLERNTELSRRKWT